MFKLIKWIDRQFYKFMPDPVGRLPLMHVPFWGFFLLISHTYAREYGLLAIWDYVLLVAWPIVTAKVFVALVQDENEKSFGDPYGGLKTVGFTYVIFVLIMVGIPGLYNGVITYPLQTETFSGGYHFVIEYWYKAFSLGAPIKNKKILLKFTDTMQSQSAVWQKYLFFSHVVTAPILTVWFYSNSKARAYALNEIEKKRQYEEAFRLKLAAERAEEEKRQQEEQTRKSLEEKRLKDERLKQQKMLEEEKQRKFQAKINEVKGKDPWDSGFL